MFSDVKNEENIYGFKNASQMTFFGCLQKSHCKQNSDAIHDILSAKILFTDSGKLYLHCSIC